MEALNAGVAPWRRPWVYVQPARSHATGRPYSILNQIMLGRRGEYCTFKQVQTAGGRIKKGAKAAGIVFWKIVGGANKTLDNALEEDAQSEDGKKKKPTRRACVSFPILVRYNVFHLDDVEGVAPKYPDVLPNVAQPQEQAEKTWRAYVEREGITAVTNELSDEAYYSPTADLIEIPDARQFKSTEDYYATIFHELAHSTGHKSRLNRETNSNPFSKEYAREELVAEIASAALCNLCGLETPETFENSAAYIKHWKEKITDDPVLIVVAAGRAQKAVDLILGIKSAEPETPAA